jgi:signal transduction histidine kinase
VALRAGRRGATSATPKRAPRVNLDDERSNKMFKKLLAVAVSVAIPFASAMAQESRASRADAERMVRKALETLKKDGKDKAYAEFTAPSRTFVDRDLYVVVYDLNGVPLAHGQNAKQVGKNLLDLRDPDGKLFVKERVELARSRGKFWQDYKFTDPLTKKVLPKQMYCERAGDVVVCSGVYKDGA